jgi:diketogulonate reductase-like aldo/keto reductase
VPTPEQPTVPLRDGRAIPQLGFGVFQIPTGSGAQAAMARALAATRGAESTPAGRR